MEGATVLPYGGSRLLLAIDCVEAAVRLYNTRAARPLECMACRARHAVYDMPTSSPENA